MAGVRVTHEALKKALGINEQVWITGIEYRERTDEFVVHLRGPCNSLPDMAFPVHFTFLGVAHKLVNTAEGTETMHVDAIDTWQVQQSAKRVPLGSE